MIEIEVSEGVYKRAADLPGQLSIKTVNENYTVTTEDGYDLILVTTGASDRTILLPAAADNAGRKISIMKADSGVGIVTVDAYGAENIIIDGTQFTSMMMESKGEKIDLLCDGTEWWQINRAVSAGTVQMRASEVVPIGFLECNGEAVSRSKYAVLFAAIGTIWGVGDGSTTFNLPDLRGYFLRGWDHTAGVDPDAGSRTDRGDGTTGDHVGTKQDDAFQGHYHRLHPTTNKYNGGSSYLTVGNQCGTASITGNPNTSPVNVPITDGSHGTPKTASESRGKNITVMYIIKY